MSWTVAGTVIAFLSLCGAAFGYIRRRVRGRKIITYELLASVPFLPNVPGLEAAGLSVIHNGEKLDNAHLLQVQVVSKSARDISTKSFDQGRPLCFDVGAPVVALLEAAYCPDQPPLPEVEITETGLQIRPDIIRSRQDMRFSVLVNGPGARLTCSSNPLLNYRLREATSYQARQKRSLMIRRIIIWAILVFLAFYLLTQPEAVQNLVDGLKAVGNSLASFVNSL